MKNIKIIEYTLFFVIIKNKYILILGVYDEKN